MKHFFSAAVCAALVSVPFSSALAAPINHGDFVGTTVTYEQVTEDALSAGDSAGLFGAPTITGDSIDFDPVSFSASASGAAGTDTTAANVEFDIVARAGSVINTLTFTEAGNTSLSGLSNEAYTKVEANLIIDIEEVDGSAIAGGPINVTEVLTFTPSAGDYSLITDGGGGPSYSAIWSGVANVDLLQILADNSVSFVGGVTRVSVTLTNTLTALSQDGTSAFISKQDTDGISITVNVPEPTTACMVMLLASSALAFARKRV